MAENRVRDWQRRQRALRRDINREVSLSALRGGIPAANEASETSDFDPADALQRVLARLTSAERRLVEGRQAGASWLELARHHGKSADALRMQLRRALDRALREIEDDG